MGKTEVQEIVVCIMQISDKRRDGDIFMDLRCRDCLRFRQKVDDSQECICVDLILPAYFPDVFLSEPQVDTEAAHHKDHRIILAYQVTHLTCFPVFSVLHVSHIFYYLYSRLIISMHIEVHPPVRQLCIPFRSASPDGTREHVRSDGGTTDTGFRYIA